MKRNEDEYAKRLVQIQMVWWKRWFGLQAPYRWNLRRLEPGLTLEIGCGIGRNLLNLDGQGIGVDRNAECVRIARARGLTAFTVEEFEASSYFAPESFDSLMLSHVVEHMSKDETLGLLRRYLALLRYGGKLILMTPQELGFRSDPTHVNFVDFEKLRTLISDLGLKFAREYSFPFPRWAGKIFIYNEFVSVGIKA